MKIILQTNKSDCLLTCAAMIMDSYGCKIPVYQLVEKVELSMAGSNVLQLKQVLGELGFNVEGYRLGFHEMSGASVPFIAHVNSSHFVVISKITKKKIIGIDPAIGKITYSYDEFNSIYSGVIITIGKAKDYVKTKRKEQKDLIEFISDKKLILILVGLFVTSIFTQIVAVSYSYMYSLAGTDESYFQLILVVLLAIVLLGTGSMIQGILTKRFNILYEQLYGNKLIDRLMEKNYKFFSFRSNGDLLYRINARGMIKDAILLKIVTSLISLCTIILVQILIFNKNILLSMVLLGVNIIYLLIYIFISKKSYMESNKYTQKLIQLNTTSENIIRTIPTIKVLDVEKVFMEKWHSENVIQAEHYGHLVVIQSIQSIFTNIYTYMVPIAISILSIVLNSGEDVFNQMALIPLLYLLVQNVAIIAQALNSIYNVLPNIDKTQELLDEQFMQDKKRVYATLDRNQQVVTKNMSYYYGRVKCLSEVNINIEKGKKYAVIGASGSGKSTLLKIIANLLNDCHGEVLFNEEINISKPIYLDQEASILDGSIMENILFGQQCINERLLEICQAVGLDDIIKKQPQNWMTNISKGRNLSRGQEQRICLARCLIKDSDMYLLDEATSNIDILDEEKIINGLIGKDGILKNKTILISTHKLNMVNYVDEVIFIDDGRVYQDSHQELLAKNSSYRAFFGKNK